jgi:hypothetical protein
VPELARFFNIIIRMLYSDDSKHSEPNIHAVYAVGQCQSRTMDHRNFGKRAEFWLFAGYLLACV